MSDSVTLEKELERRAENDADAKKFWGQYSVVKRHLTDNFYPWIHDNSPYFTDHGEKHVESVIRTASALLIRDLGPEEKSRLKSLDLFLLLSAIIWHDVGMVFKRFGHAEEVERITSEVKDLAFGDPTIHRLIVQIAKAHSGKEGLEVPELEQDWDGAQSSYTVYPRALAAIVRFADEVSENRSRISQALLKKVPNENRIYWEYANCITASRPDPPRERIIISLEIQEAAALESYLCPEELRLYGNNSEEISLIEYIIRRLEKMNNERSYCAPEFNRYITIKEIEVRMSLLGRVDRIPGYDLNIILGDLGLSQGGYPEVEIFQQFFNEYP